MLCSADSFHTSLDDHSNTAAVRSKHSFQFATHTAQHSSFGKELRDTDRGALSYILDGGALNTLYAKSYSLLYLNNGLPSSTSLCSLELSAVNGLDATTLFPHKQKDHSNTSTAYFSPCAKWCRTGHFPFLRQKLHACSAAWARMLSCTFANCDLSALA